MVDAPSPIYAIPGTSLALDLEAVAAAQPEDPESEMLREGSSSLFFFFCRATPAYVTPPMYVTFQRALHADTFGQRFGSLFLTPFTMPVISVYVHPND